MYKNEMISWFSKDTVLVVDLDGTLIYTDLLLESILKFIKRYPYRIGVLINLLFKSRLNLKNDLSEHVDVDPQLLPYNREVIDFICQFKSEENRKVVLASASPYRYVEKIANHLGCFNEYYGTVETNLKGENKLKLIFDKFGPNVVYLGNSNDDLPIWKGLNKALVANPSRGVINHLKGSQIPFEVISHRKPMTLRKWLKSIRIHQWAKNSLILLPFLAAHKIADLQSWVLATVAALAFCFIASSVYVMNDLLDLEADRAHPTKSRRPFASGDIPILLGVGIVPVLLLCSCILSLILPPTFSLVIFLYFFVNFLYSFYLKKIHTLDLVLLASMYSARLVAGGEATSTRVTPWLGAFSIFFFFGLAAVKRFTEISKIENTKKTGRGYLMEDKYPILALGVASSMVSAVVFALYVNSPQISSLYTRPKWLWMILPILLYWISRIWVIAGRGEVHADPVLFTLKDKQSYFIGIICVTLIWMAI